MLVLQQPEDRDELDSVLGINPDPERMKVGRRSEVTTCEACPRRALLSYVYGIRPVVRAPGRDQSSYGHMTIAMLLRGMSPTATMGVVDMIMQDVAASSGYPTDTDRAQDASLGFACGCYLHDKLVTYVLDKGFSIQNVETKFNGKMVVKDGDRKIEIPFGFQTDFIIDAGDAGLYLWDTKIIGTSAELYATQAKLSFQTAVYVLWARMIPELGNRVKGIIYGICSKPSCSRKGLTKGEGQDVDDYVKECYENLEGVGRWCKLAEKRGNEKAMNIVGCYPTAFDLQLATRRLTDCMIRKSKGRNNMAFPPHDDCVSGYMKCDFLDLCQHGQIIWKNLIRGQGSKFTMDADPLNSDRISGRNLRPVKVAKVIPVPMLPGLNDIYEKKNRGKLTTKWRESKLGY